MNKYIFLGTLLALGCTQVQAAKQSYKCYLLTTEGEEIAFYRWNEPDLPTKQAALVATKRKDNQGKTYYIKDVKECVLLSEAFSSAQAQALDKQTLR
ncbi:TapY2 family type IVa secretion system protein [Shewanella dokdonensis]|uniref:TapY2 family type IVa secretion system protein n=1 Tax=Shewanella dokdonensis TaxID=712036 RepID=UPI00200E0DF1|nr:TapY2 family type IVa secretion system protein [Shewanella dokdonensis]MCL1073609.1 TapY2 family type IVa secretion system protein [Shewanella dokdonensis]